MSETVDVTVRLPRPPEGMGWEVRGQRPAAGAGNAIDVTIVLRPIVPATVTLEGIPRSLAEELTRTDFGYQVLYEIQKAARAALARKPETLCRKCGYSAGAHATGEEGPLDGNVCHKFTSDRKPCPVMVCALYGGKSKDCWRKDIHEQRPCKHSEGHGGEHE